MRPVLAALILLSALVLPAAASGQPTPGSRVLVMPFTAEVEPGAAGGAGAALWLGEAASLLLTEGLSTQGVGALRRSERVAAFEELNVPMTSALTRATMIRIGELIGASEIIFGSVRLGEALEVRARMVRLGDGREMPIVTDTAPLAQIFTVFGRVATRLSGHTGRSRPTATAAAPPLPLETFENYVKGLVAATPQAQQRFLEDAVRQASGDPRILLALWQAYTTQGFHDRALGIANAVPPDSPAYRRARFAVALSLVELGRFDGAFQALTQLHGIERSASVSNALGVVQLRRGTPAGGSAPAVYFKRAVDEEPENTDYLFNLGYAHAIAQNTADALVWLREAVRFDAASGDAHLVMSAALAAAGRTTEAQRELELARLLGTEAGASPMPLSARVPAGLERLASSAELSSAARLRTVIGNPSQRDQQETAAFHLNNGRALVAAGRDREATSELRRAIYLAPYADEPHLLLGQIYQRTGRIAEAVDEFTVAIWSRETGAARLALADALLEQGQTDAARREATRALVLMPGSAEAKALLAKIGG